jgi:cytochrome b561/polyisoprenoid-binding protein YceI
VAIVLHWLLALGMAVQVGMGFAMPHNGPESFAPMQLHKSIGILILILTLARLAWRLGHRPPPPVEGGFAGFLAKAVHFGFYVILLVGPLTGWAIVSTARLKVPTFLFGTVPWPHLPLPASINHPMEEVHEWLGWIALALFVLHVIGALRHHYLLHDGILKRMAPGGSVAAVLALLVATVALYFGVGSYVSATYLVPAMERMKAERAARVAAPEAAPTVAPTTEPVPTPTPTDTATPAAEEAGPPPVWTIQGGKRLGFTVSGGGEAYRGSFSDWSGAITFDPDHPESADLRITVKLASASLGNATTDAMLQGAEFFASSANPTATWRSTKVTQTGPNRYRASGTLSLKGASRPQTVTFTLSGKDLKRHVEGSASIDRTAFGVGTGDAAASVDKLVSLSFSFDATGRRPS